tara:strand:- start:78 stop:257 length:180 start_codon:yes stop_codon:yes gene_type:complete
MENPYRNPYSKKNREKRIKNMYDFYVEWAKRNNVKPVSREEYMHRLWRGTSPKWEAPNA